MNEHYFQVSGFQSLSMIQNNEYYKRSIGPPGVYSWGFTLRENGKLPIKEDELIVYYIGKREPGAKYSLKSPIVRENVYERIMQEVAHLFGGFGTVIDKNHMLLHPFDARIKEQQDQKTNHVLYSVEGLHTLLSFFSNAQIQDTVDWMKQRFVFCWIEFNPNYYSQQPLAYHDEIRKLENEMHHIVRTNVLGVGKINSSMSKKDINNVNETPFFNYKIDWSKNPILENWLKEVNNRI
jgi:hypothetical protein